MVLNTRVCFITIQVYVNTALQLRQRTSRYRAAAIAKAFDAFYTYMLQKIDYLCVLIVIFDMK